MYDCLIVSRVGRRPEQCKTAWLCLGDLSSEAMCSCLIVALKVVVGNIARLPDCVSMGRGQEQYTTA